MMRVSRPVVLVGRLLFVLSFATLAAAASLLPVGLQCEYRENPEGIGETSPRLGWQLSADPAARGVRQTAYEIAVAGTREQLVSGRADVWSSGTVPSDRTSQIVYGGPPLSPRQTCWWRVRVWDEAGQVSAWSEPARWSIGLLAPTDWTAKWIGLDATMAADPAVPDTATRERVARLKWAYADVPVSKTSPLTATFRGTVSLPTDRKVVRAAAAITVDQVAVLFCNGDQVADLSRWEQLRAVDLTGRLVPGENVVGLEITQRDGHPPAALGEITVEFADGTKQSVPVDGAWRFSMEPKVGWNRAGFDVSAWKPVISPPQKRNPWDGPPQTFTYWLPPAAYLRKGFVAEKPVRRAVVYATALGVYELRLNGERVGEDYLTPGWTDFRARVQYQTYDVTSKVRRGGNVLGAILGDGWYASILGYTGRRYFYDGYPRLLAQLEIEYADGSKTAVATDESWHGTAGEIRHADLMAGCAVDRRRDLGAWTDPTYDAAGWQPVATGLRPVDPAKPIAPFVVEAANAEPTRITEVLRARRVSEPRPGAWTYDLGQNMVGWVRLKVRGRPGQKVMVRHAEMLNPNGTVYTSNLRGANAVDVYWLRGGEEEVLEPYFTFHGFRYVEVTGLEAAPALDAVSGVVAHSAMARTGDFECSHPLVNQLYRNVVWGQRGNYVEVPTDCPQRDERAGWTGDAEFFIRAGSYNFDVAGFFTRWLGTLVRDTQLPTGAFGNVAPLFGTAWTSAGWSDSALVCTHTMFRVYGDTRIVERNFDAMNRYMAWVASQSKDGVVALRGRGIGDHLNLDGGAPTTVIETAYYAYLSDAMAEMAAAIGRNDDATRYRDSAATARAAFQREFVTEDGEIKNSRQVGYALAFAWDLLSPEQQRKAAGKFVGELEARDWHLGTGFIGTPRLLPGLHRAGRDDAAYRILLQETYPSWLFQVKNGATTIWERWDGWTPDQGFQTIAMNSFNHYAFGSVAEYLYRFVAGIDTVNAGFKTVTIAPAVETGLSWARARYDSISGPIRSAWKREGAVLTLTVEIPPNVTATVSVPAKTAESVHESGVPAAQAKGVTFVNLESGRAVYRVGSGRYEFTAR